MWRWVGISGRMATSATMPTISQERRRHLMWQSSQLSCAPMIQVEGSWVCVATQTSPRALRSSSLASISRLKGPPHRRQHQRQRQDALIRISIAQIGPPTESARAIPASCWTLVPQVAVPAPRQRQPRRRRLHHRHPRQQLQRQDALIRISIAQIGPPAGSARAIPASCSTLVPQAAVPALRQGLAPTTINIARIGPPVDSVRRIPTTCWSPVVGVAASAPCQLHKGSKHVSR